MKLDYLVRIGMRKYIKPRSSEDREKKEPRQNREMRKRLAVRRRGTKTKRKWMEAKTKKDVNDERGESGR